LQIQAYCIYFGDECDYLTGDPGCFSYEQERASQAKEGRYIGSNRHQPMAMARQVDSPVTLSRSEASPRPPGQTLRCGSG